jgi:Zn-dependent alcohol dehydrogenase
VEASRGAILTALGAPFEVVDLTWDQPQPDEVGVRVTACGVCHSDWHAANGDYPVEYPILVGHEGVGIIERVGANVRRVAVGDHVVMSWMPSCGHCAWCSAGKGHLCDRGARLLSGERDDGTPRVWTADGTAVRQMSFLGAFSDYVVIPEDGCIVIDDDFDLAKIAPIGCRVPTGFGAATIMAGVGQGSTALVVGLGGVGMNVLQGLRAAGAVVIIAADRVDKRQWAQRFGATTTSTPRAATWWRRYAASPASGWTTPSTLSGTRTSSRCAWRRCTRADGPSGLVRRPRAAARSTSICRRSRSTRRPWAASATAGQPLHPGARTAHALPFGRGAARRTHHPRVSTRRDQHGVRGHAGRTKHRRRRPALGVDVNGHERAALTNSRHSDDTSRPVPSVALSRPR